MPAWMAGIQVRKDASENIHVSLDSSTPCWNHAIEGVLHELTKFAFSSSAGERKLMKHSLENRETKGI
jgi:hypothetical protein